MCIVEAWHRESALQVDRRRICTLEVQDLIIRAYCQHFSLPNRDCGNPLGLAGRQFLASQKVSLKIDLVSEALLGTWNVSLQPFFDFAEAVQSGRTCRGRMAVVRITEHSRRNAVLPQYGKKNFH